MTMEVETGILQYGQEKTQQFEDRLQRGRMILWPILNKLHPKLHAQSSGRLGQLLLVLCVFVD